MAESSLRFAADRTLGRLAKWLRLIGIDTLYGPQWSGPALLRVARTEQRIVLTRDTRLRRVRERPPMLFIESDRFREQLRQVLDAFRIDPYAQLLTRCARCNAVVQSVPRDAVSSRVPAYVFATQEAYVRCPRCGRVYWPATHAARVRDELERLGYSAGPAHL
jgi:uncharacterized protein